MWQYDYICQQPKVSPLSPFTMNLFDIQSILCDRFSNRSCLLIRQRRRRRIKRQRWKFLLFRCLALSQFTIVSYLKHSDIWHIQIFRLLVHSNICIKRYQNIFFPGDDFEVCNWIHQLLAITLGRLRGWQVNLNNI